MLDEEKNLILFARNTKSGQLYSLIITLFMVDFMVCFACAKIY